MKKHLKDLKATRVLFILLCALLIAGSMGVTAHALDTYYNDLFEGSGTEDDPFLIQDDYDWKDLASAVNNGKKYGSTADSHNYNEAYYRLTNDIGSANSPVTRVIGEVRNAADPTSSDMPFCGHLNGGGHTIRINIDESTSIAKKGTALFRLIEGAEISDLIVLGTVKGTSNTSGLVGYSSGSGNLIERCLVYADVTDCNSGGAGGIIGYCGTSSVTIKDTVFGGALHADGDQNYTAGLVRWCEAGATLTIDNCMFSGTFTGSAADWFHPVAVRSVFANVTAAVSEVFYTQEKGGSVSSLYIAADGIKVSKTVPEGRVYQTVASADLFTYYAEGSVSGVNDKYTNHNGSPIRINCVVKDVYGNALTEGTDYTLTFSPEEVKDIGDYTLTVRGIGSYAGEQVLSFSVVDSILLGPTSTTWEDGYTYRVQNRVYIPGRITVNGTVRLILDSGATLTADKGITVNEGNTLIIDGPGTLTAGTMTSHSSLVFNNSAGELCLVDINDAETESYIMEFYYNQGITCSVNDDGRKGGGHLVFEQTVDVPNVPNGCAGIGAAGGSNCGTIIINGGRISATGGLPGLVVGEAGIGIGGTGSTVMLDWSDEGDWIESTGYAGTVSFASGKVFRRADDSSLVTAENLSAGEIMPEPVCSHVSLSVTGGYGLTADLTDNVPQGATVTLTQTGGLAYASSLTVTGSDSRSVPVMMTGIDTYTFVMPPCDVTVSASFASFDMITYEGRDYRSLYPASAPAGWFDGNYAADADITIPERVTISGDVRLLLIGGKTLTCSKGITVPEGSSLTIEGGGKLIADAGSLKDAAGIGALDERDEYGRITILGGVIEARGINMGSGIGGSRYTNNGEIIIKGGRITTTSEYGYSIGSSNGTVTLGWTDENDFIEAKGGRKGYGGTVSFENGKYFIKTDTKELATTSNLVGSRIVPFSGTVHSISSANGGNGSLEITSGLSASTAMAGTGVRVSWTPDDGYTLDALTVTDENGSEIPLIVAGEMERVFIMPDGDASVSISFKQTDRYVKSLANTRMGMDWVSLPQIYTNPLVYYDDAEGILVHDIILKCWCNWSYVYFGQYNGTPVRYRVLNRASNEYGVDGGSLFLDCDNVLRTIAFDDSGSDVWINSTLRAWLNGTQFLNNDACFSAAERSAIAPSVKEHRTIIYGSVGWGSALFHPLAGEKVFILDNEDLHRQELGYIGDYGWNDKPFHAENRKKTDLSGRVIAYWTRSPVEVKYYINNDSNQTVTEYQPSAIGGDGADGGETDSYYAGCIVGAGTGTDTEVFGSPVGVSPAMNIRLSDIMFVSMISDNGSEKEFKLTLFDSSLSASVQAGKSITRDGQYLTIPYSVTGDPNRLSLLVTKGDYTNHDIRCYEVLKDGDIDENGTITIGLPEDVLTEEYEVYLIAEKENGAHYTDYASTPARLGIPGATTAPVIRSHTLLLSGQIGVNFYADLSMLSDAEKQAVSMEFTVNGKTQTAAFDPDFTNPGGNGYYGFTCYINSVQMADEITAVLKFLGGGEVRQTYSAAQYIEYIQQHPGSYSSNALALVNAIADYGHYVQPFLAGHNNWTIGTDHAEMTAASAYTAADAESARLAVDGNAFSVDYGNSQIDAVTYSLNLKSETSIYIYLKFKDGYNGENLVYYKDTFDALPCEVRSDGRYRLEIPSINATGLGQNYRVVVSTGGEECVINVSALSYVRAALNSANSTFANDTARYAVTSLYRYYAAAAEYAAHPND